MERTQVIIDDNKRAITIRTATGTFTQSGVSKPIIDYITTLQEENERLKRENNLLKADIEASQEIICDYKEEYENENERLNFNYKEALDEIDRLNNIIKEIRKLADKYEMGKYDYNVPSFEIKEILDKENKQ